MSIYTIRESGLISIPDWADGRLIPAVVINNEETGEELKDFLRLHISENIRGDVTTQWATPLFQIFKAKHRLLSLTFTKPRDFSFYIRFSLEENTALIDAIFQSRGLYILYGYEGDKISKNPNEDMILIEVPELGQDIKWNRGLREIIKSKMTKQKVPKKQINREVENQIKKMREIINFKKLKV